MNSLVKDSVRLCTNIWDTLLPNETWAVVNIAKTENPVFNYPTTKIIPSSFGYIYDRVPQFLIKNGVIEASVKGRWYIEVCNGENESTDDITSVAREKGYLSKKEWVQYYYKSSKYEYERLGPNAAGQYAILVNVNRMVRFIRRNYSTIPQFSKETGILTFLGNVVRFDGEIEKKSVDLLIDKVNSMVSREEFYNIPRGLSNYNMHVKSNRKTVHDSLKKIFKKIKNRIDNDPLMKDALVLVQQEGYGIFVDQRSLLLNPQSESNKSPNTR